MYVSKCIGITLALALFLSAGSIAMGQNDVREERLGLGRLRVEKPGKEAKIERLRKECFISAIDQQIIGDWWTGPYVLDVHRYSRTYRHDGTSWRERETGRGIRLLGLEPEGTIQTSSLRAEGWKEVEPIATDLIYFVRHYIKEYHGQIGRRLHFAFMEIPRRQEQKHSKDLTVETTIVFLPDTYSCVTVVTGSYSEWERKHHYNGSMMFRFLDQEAAEEELKRRAESDSTQKSNDEVKK